MNRILLVEDDKALATLLKKDLQIEGYQVETAADGEEALDEAAKFKPHLIILDVMLPKMNGYDVCRRLRNDGNQTPILMLTAKGSEPEKVVGFNLGADDYVTKPFGALELFARIKALLRRPGRESRVDSVAFGSIVVDFKKMETRKGSKIIDLTLREYQILELLVRYRGEVVSRDKFLEEIWHTDEDITTRAIDVQVLAIRQKLGANGKDSKPIIDTVRGVGYRFVA